MSVDTPLVRHMGHLRQRRICAGLFPRAHRHMGRTSP